MSQQTGKAKVKLVGEDGNTLAVLGRAAKAMREQGFGDKVSEMRQRVFQAQSYTAALSVILDYVEAS